ncbi:flagellar hook-length control protein FliK [Desulfuribacillus alkaliarsenatis]|uniref:Flagellar hook-length control protein-like C-terminal domain-containing protein n=1 Tax=Desulfuribacillus alkaliarsenatis TaxID=766136 RepID=A0A1E5G606_9FIRM|nr:flagellar hook-length control protein FliK [Desulfuribacillus alkaliarsenatis]OEF98610.1 hypothetical protein BHF68_02800 [Desulfuribacillus alkaliarsenatis]
MNMNVFFAEFDMQQQLLPKGKKNADMGSLFADVLLNKTLLAKGETVDASLFSYEFAEMFYALSANTGNSLVGSNTSKDQFGVSDQLFTDYLLASMVSEKLSNLENDNSDYLANITELKDLLASLSMKESKAIETLVESLLESLSTDFESGDVELKSLISELDTAKLSEAFGFLDIALVMLQQLIGASQKNIAKANSLSSSQDALFQHKHKLTNKSNLSANALEILAKLENNNALLKDLLQTMGKEADKARELISMLKQLIAKTEQKSFHEGSNNQQLVTNVKQIPLHLQQNMTLPRNTESKNSQSKASDVGSQEVKAATTVNTGEVKANIQQPVTEERNSINHQHQWQQTGKELQSRDTIAVANSQNASQEATKNSSSNEVRLNYTNPNELQKQIQELVVKQAKYVKKPNGQQSLIVNLQPANLGSIKIVVAANQGQLTASIITDTVMTKELIESTINNLRVALANTGIQLDRMEIQQQNQSNQSVAQSAGAQSHLQQQKRNQDHQDEQQQKKQKSSGRFDIDELEELALDFIADNNLDKRFVSHDGYSAAVNYTA